MNNVLAFLLVVGAGVSGLFAMTRQRATRPPGDGLEPITAQGKRITAATPQPPPGPVQWLGELVQGFAPAGAPGAATDLPRGIRNNNPGNIEYSAGVDWLGQVGSDGRFIIFEHPVYGIRAMVRILRTYAGRGITRLDEIIATWAPPHENDTPGYIRFVAQRSGLGARQEVAPADYPRLIDAMIFKENGINPYSSQQLAAGQAAANTEGYA